MRPPRRRPPPRHRAPSSAARPQAGRPEDRQPGAGQLWAGPPGDGQLGDGQSEAERPTAELPAVEWLGAGWPEAGRARAEPPRAEPPRVDVPEPPRSRGTQVAPALRRLMVTPTFAAGLGVVVAAGLAVSMTARTVLHFSGPDQQKYCTARGCASGSGKPGGVGTLASAKPGIRLLPATRGPSGSPRSTFSGGQDSGHVAGSPVVIAYQTTQKWSWGFDGQIMISGIPASSLGNWRLAFDYPGTSIVEVQGAQWVPTGQDSGVAEAGTSTSSAPPSGGTSQSGTSPSGTSPSSASSTGASPTGASSTGASQSKPAVSGGDMSGSGQQSADHSGQQSTVVITIEASGSPSTPSGCRFDNAPCSFR